MWLTILAFLAVLAVLILAHELGHFITARISGVKVEEFGIGFPPRLLSIKRGETMYSLNAIPLGGFTKMAGEEDPSVPGSLAGKSTGVRLLVLSAGSIMNALLPLILLTMAFMIPHDFVVGEVAVVEVVADSPAAVAGIEPGDVFLEVNGQPVRNIVDLQRYIYTNLGEEITLLVEHSDATTEVIPIVPKWRLSDGNQGIGVLTTMPDPAIIRQHYPLWEAVPLGVQECIETFVVYKNGIISMIIGVEAGGVVGPVGIAQMTGEVARAGISPLLEFAAFLSINLAVINLLPLPALDGGRIVFVLLEWFRRGKRISPQTEGMVHFVGFVLLIGVILVITYQDIVRIIAGNGIIP